MEHTNKGETEILKRCTLPLTAPTQVDMIITEMSVFNVTTQGIENIEINPDYTFEEVQAATETTSINRI